MIGLQLRDFKIALQRLAIQAPVVLSFNAALDNSVPGNPGVYMAVPQFRFENGTSGFYQGKNPNVEMQIEERLGG